MGTSCAKNKADQNRDTIHWWVMYVVLSSSLDHNMMLKMGKVIKSKGLNWNYAELNFWLVTLLVGQLGPGIKNSGLRSAVQDLHCLFGTESLGHFLPRAPNLSSPLQAKPKASGDGGAGFVLSQSCKVHTDPEGPRPQCWALGLASAGLASDSCSLKLLDVVVCVVGLRRAGSPVQPGLFHFSSVSLALGWIMSCQLCSMTACHENWGMSDWCSLGSGYGRENSHPGWSLSLTAYSYTGFRYVLLPFFYPVWVVISQNQYMLWGLIPVPFTDKQACTKPVICFLQFLFLSVICVLILLRQKKLLRFTDSTEIIWSQTTVFLQNCGEQVLNEWSFSNTCNWNKICKHGNLQSQGSLQHVL